MNYHIRISTCDIYTDQGELVASAVSEEAANDLINALEFSFNKYQLVEACEDHELHTRTDIKELIDKAEKFEKMEALLQDLEELSDDLSEFHSRMVALA